MYFFNKPLTVATDSNLDTVEEITIYAAIGTTKMKTEKVLGTAIVLAEQYAQSVEVIRIDHEGLRQDAKFDASRSGPKLKESDVRELLKTVAAETRGQVSVLGSNYKYHKLIARSQKREIVLIGRKPRPTYETENVDTQND